MNEIATVDVLGETEVAEGRCRVVKRDGAQVAVFRSGGRLYALDNRCPHEGYPLSQGSIKDGVLTCPWHNWKFDAATGRCLEGGEDVRAYAPACSSGRIRLDLSPEPAEVAVERRLKSLRRALAEHKVGQAARDSVRLLDLGQTPENVLAEAAAYGAAHAEYGFDHGLAALADCARLTDVPGLPATVRLAQGISMVTETNQRRPPRPAPAPANAGPDFAVRVRERIEDEDASSAEALVRGQLSAAGGPSSVRGPLLAAATDHFLGYGHGLIYTVKALQLVEALGAAGAAHTPAILGSAVPSMVWLTREDVLPYMAPYRKAMKVLEPHLATVPRGGSEPFDAVAFSEVLLREREEAAMTAAMDLLARGASPAAVASAIAGAAGDRLLGFDLSIDQDPSVDVGWLDVTHLVTFANAARHAVTMEPGPDTFRGLLQAAWFVSYVRQAEMPARSRLRPLDGSDRDHLLGRFTAATEARDPETAMAATAAYLDAGHPLEPLGHAIQRLALSDVASTFIMVAHVIKTTAATLEEAPRLLPPLRRTLLLGLTRFLAAPRRERFVARNAVLAEQMVRERSA